MDFTRILTAALLVGASACSSQPGSTSQDTVAVTAAQALVATPTQSTPSHHKHSRDAALAALPTLHELVASGKPQHRGFRSVDEAKSATPTDPMPMYGVGLTALSAFRPGQDARALLVDKEEQLFPVAVDGDVRTSMIVRKQPGGDWETTQFVHGPMAPAVHQGRHRVSKGRGVDATSLMFIDVPSLATLLGHDERGTLMVTPVYDIAGTQMRAGETYKASEVFALLQPLAAQAESSAPN
jgi:hypothetical protein